MPQNVERGSDGRATAFRKSRELIAAAKNCIVTIMDDALI